MKTLANPKRVILRRKDVTDVKKTFARPKPDSNVYISNIGRIDLLSSYSLFDVEKSSAPKVIGALKGNEFYGHRIYAELATDKDYSAPKGKRKGKEEGGRRTNEKRYGNSRRDHSESRSRRDRSSSKTKRNSHSSKKRKG